jgi:hypothetical protein
MSKLTIGIVPAGISCSVNSVEVVIRKPVTTMAAAALLLPGGVGTASAQYWHGDRGSYCHHGWGGSAVPAGLIGGAVLRKLIALQR